MASLASTATQCSLHAQLLGDERNQLPSIIQQVHSRRPLRLAGVATVLRGTGWLSRLGGLVAGLPPAGQEQPLVVFLRSQRDGAGDRPVEQWERCFGQHAPMRSQLHAADGSLVEVLGAVHLRFRLDAARDGIRWRAIGGALWGWCRMPRAWLEGIQAMEFEQQGHYAFQVRVELPLVGLVVDYRGVLRIDPACMAST